MKSPSFFATALFCGFGTATLPAAVVTTNWLYNGGNVNHALTGTASQTTTNYGAPASRANDGNTTQGYGNNSTTHTDDTVPGTVSWQVDLLGTKPVQTIQLWNRGEGLNIRLSNFRLQVLNTALTEVWGQDFYTAPGTSVGDSELVTLPGGISGQHVRVQQLGLNNQGNNVLSLTEVQVMSTSPQLYPNKALASAGGSASQSSEGYGGAASRAIDGNTDGSFGGNSVTHTDDTVPPGSAVWFQVNLASDTQINEISLWNRTDCCGARLSNYKLSVLDNGSEVWSQTFLNGSPNVGKSIISVHDDLGGFFATGDQVRLELIGGVDGTGANNIHLAEFQVFGNAIPEPSGLGLLGFAAGAAVIARRRRK